MGAPLCTLERHAEAIVRLLRASFWGFPDRTALQRICWESLLAEFVFAFLDCEFGGLDPELHDIYMRGLFEPETLTREQRGRFELLVMQLLRGTESGWLQVEWGLVDMDYWEGFRETVKLIVGSKAGKRAFDRNRKLLSLSFAAEIDKIVGGQDE